MKPNFKTQTKNGFALVVTISMMVLLTIVVVATLSLSTITLRTVDKESAQAVARANARLALMLAIGQLQKEAGPDKRITATADIEDAKANPQWVGVWKTGENETNSKPTWLVSGADPQPESTLNESNSALISGSPSSDSSRKEIRAEFVKIEGKNLDGRYAYWVGDESTKARVDVANPDERTDELGFRERVGRSQSPQEPGFAAFDRDHREMWAGFDSDYRGSIDRKVLASMETVALAAKDSGDLKRKDIPNHYFNDLTTGGFGLPVNVWDGGMKDDLSLIFDRSQQNEAFVADFFGAKPQRDTIAGATVYKFAPSASNYEKFGLSKSVTQGLGSGFVGPNWGTLFNYSRLWETVSGNKSPMIGLEPRVDSNLRQPGWKPYAQAFKPDAFQQDIQHTNSGLSPVISMAQISFLMGSELDTSAGGKNPQYRLSLKVKPVVGLWNPYNVHINPAQYQLEWATAPYLDLRADGATATPVSDGGNPPKSYNVSPTAIKIWLRDYWAVAGGVFPKDGADGGGSYMRLRTTAIGFQPGEFRLFSVEGSPLMADSNTANSLVPTLNPTGAFKVKLFPDEIAKVRDENARKLVRIDKNSLRYGEGVRIRIPTFDMQDTHEDLLPLTEVRFNGISTEASNTWFTLKAGAPGGAIETHLNRYTDIWNGQKKKSDFNLTIPEPISEKDGAPPVQLGPIEGLGAGKHIATWRFYTRNPTELTDVSQGLRGWIDCNPRVMSSVMRFDGSENKKAGFQGFNVISNLMGAEAEDTRLGDGKGGNRGLVRVGGAVPIPEGVTTNSTRWQGYGGPSSTSSGYTHVIVYDVPQAPLTSVGQFQHANLSRYNYEPGFVVGNSYANPRIPLASTVARNFGGMGFDVVDTSYEVNKRLWDSVFFSTLGMDYKDGGGTSFDTAFDRQALLLRKKSLPNPRMVYTELPGDKSIDTTIKEAGNAAPRAIATRILIEGAFNVNSTSVTAWKAVLSTMDGAELPVINPTNDSAGPNWVMPSGLRFSRFNHPILADGFKGGGRSPTFWQGWRELSDGDLDELAKAIVNEVKERGPFKSMAEFVNRNPNGNPNAQRKGALQAAIDLVANKSISEDIGLPSGPIKGANFPGSTNGENQSAGHAGYLLQGDILQCLAPIMQVRSDYFRIRTCGEALDKSGKVLAKAWCEAFIQRMPDYVDSADKPETKFLELRSDVNTDFGRRFKLVSFRWLNPSEI